MKNRRPQVFGLFEKRIDGDDALLELARHRFREAGLGMECYAGCLADIERYRTFRYGEDTPMVFHLPRWIDLMKAEHERFVMDFLAGAAGVACGVVVHDQPELVNAPAAYRDVLAKLGSLIASIPDSPRLFVEYAAMLDPDRFTAFFGDFGRADGIGACVDIGHIGSKITADLFCLAHEGFPLHSLKPSDPALPDYMDAVVAAAAGALPGVVTVVRELIGFGTPLHFHLHDGHPLSDVSAYEVPDHLSFLSEVPIPFEYGGKRALSTMFGPAGLGEIVSTALSTGDRSLVSFALEIHPDGGRSPLGDLARLFSHWSDLSHAEQMNHWLSELISNYDLLTTIIDREQG